MKNKAYQSKQTKTQLRLQATVLTTISQEKNICSKPRLVHTAYVLFVTFPIQCNLGREAVEFLPRWTALSLKSLMFVFD